MEEKKQSEINLLDLFSILFAWLRKVFHGLLVYMGKLSRLIYRRKWYVAATVVAGVAVGLYLSRPAARIYKAEGTALILGADAQTVRQVFRQLENSDPRNPYTSLTGKLNLPDSVADNIVQLAAYYMIDYMRDSVADKVDYLDSHSLTDTMNVRMRDRVHIRLNSNAVILSQYNARINDLKNQISICDRELNRIDSLAAMYYFREKDNAQLSFEKNSLIMGEQRKQLFYGDLMRIQEYRNHAQLELSRFTKPVEIPSSLVVSPQPVNGRMEYAVYGMLIGLVAGLLLAGFVESISHIMAFLKGNN
jgi:hypothetical protein